MLGIGSFWPSAMRHCAVYSATVRRKLPGGMDCGPGAIALHFDGGGRDVAVIGLTAAAAKQLLDDLAVTLAPEPVPAPVEVKPVVPAPVEVKPEVKPVEVKPAAHDQRRRP